MNITKFNKADIIKKSKKLNISVEDFLINLRNNNTELLNYQEDSTKKTNEIKTESSTTKDNRIDLVYEAIDSCNNYIDVIIENIKKLTGLYQENKLKEGDKQFSEVIDILDLFIQLISQVYRSLKETKGSQFDKAPAIQQLEVHLLSVIKGLVPAKEKKDIIMLCDLLEYELIDNLRQWKINVIPSLKKTRDSISGQ